MAATTADTNKYDWTYCGKGFSLINVDLLKLVNRLPSAIVHSLLGEFVPIFVLHRAHHPKLPYGHDLEFIRECLAHIRKENYNPLSLEVLMKKHLNREPIPPKTVVFTIDDGFRDNIVDTAEVFSEFDIPLTCFVITEFVDRHLWPWDNQIKFALSESKLSQCDIELPDGKYLKLSDPNTLENCRYVLRDTLKRQPQSNLYHWLEHHLFPQLEVDLPSSPPEEYQPGTWQEIVNFVAQGHCVAPHTATHRILSMLTDDESKHEIESSWRMLCDRLNKVSPVFAYPTGREGDFTAREEMYCANAGLIAATTTTTGYYRPETATFQIPRLMMPKNLKDFVQYIGVIGAIKESL